MLEKRTAYYSFEFVHANSEKMPIEMKCHIVQFINFIR